MPSQGKCPGKPPCLGRESSALSPNYSLNTMRETISFYDTSSNAKKKREGVLIGNYLAIANISYMETKYRIFRIKEGIPLLDAFFRDVEDAIKFAEYIDQQYSEYFPIWEEYPHADLFNLVKWTVPDGIQWYEAMKMLRKADELKLSDISYVYNLAERNVPEWFSIR